MEDAETLPEALMDPVAEGSLPTSPAVPEALAVTAGCLFDIGPRSRGVPIVGADMGGYPKFEHLPGITNAIHQWPIELDHLPLLLIPGGGTRSSTTHWIGVTGPDCDGSIQVVPTMPDSGVARGSYTMITNGLRLRFEFTTEERIDSVFSDGSHTLKLHMWDLGGDRGPVVLDSVYVNVSLGFAQVFRGCWYTEDPDDEGGTDPPQQCFDGASILDLM
ncbi:MAG: hypothetical protein OXQ94_18410 [Gemmatimonadota bacterium]|nr:hypothetical protein [Gemmatimonadota bacterium]MDE2873648.1 hypothetical protein [Gemmatimonadota bacterium]